MSIYYLSSTTVHFSPKIHFFSLLLLHSTLLFPLVSFSSFTLDMDEKKVSLNELLVRHYVFGYYQPTLSIFQGQDCYRSGDMPQTLSYFPRKILILVQTYSLHLALLEHCIPPFLLVSILICITFQKVIIWNQLSLYMNSAFV